MKIKDLYYGADGELGPLDRLKLEIARIVQNEWEATGSGIFLPEVGKKLSSSFDHYDEILGTKKLLRVIEDEVSSVLVERDPTNPKRIVVAPKDRGDDSALFGKKKIPYFDQAFWRAFSRPLGNEKRAIRITDDGYETVSGHYTKAPNVYPVTKQFTSSFDDDSSASKEAIYEKINKWLSRNNLSEESFYDISGRVETALDQLHSMLGRDASRVSLPVDVALRLSRTTKKV